MTIAKVATSHLIHINLDAGGTVTHAWQDTTYSIQEDGVEIGTQKMPSENVEPSHLADVLPEQADLIRKVADLTAAVMTAENEAAKARGEATASEKAATSAAETISNLHKQLAASRAGSRPQAANNDLSSDHGTTTQ